MRPLLDDFAPLLFESAGDGGLSRRWMKHSRYPMKPRFRSRPIAGAKSPVRTQNMMQDSTKATKSPAANIPNMPNVVTTVHRAEGSRYIVSITLYRSVSMGCEDRHPCRLKKGVVVSLPLLIPLKTF